MSELERLRETLYKIAELASSAQGDDYQDPNYGAGNGSSDAAANGDEVIVCTPKTLPKRLLESAAKTAVEINPMNAPAIGPLAALGRDFVAPPMFITLLTSKYWGNKPRKLSVSFMEQTSSELRARILSHMNAWAKTSCVSFVETKGVGEVRISRGGGGYWSYLGTDILHIPQDSQTMNLEGFTMSTRESEFKRVVRHEAGHTLGFMHEHMRRELVVRIDPEKAYEYFLRTQGWDRRTVDQQVLTPLDEGSIIGTPADETSIMCYQLPGEITHDGEPIIGGVDINRTDFDFAGRIYPKPGHLSSVIQETWEGELAAT